MGFWIYSLNEFQNVCFGCELFSSKGLDEVRRGGRLVLETGLMSVPPASSLPGECLD